MNRYEIEGAVRDAERGKLVLYLAESRRTATESFRRVADHLSAAGYPFSGVKLYRSNGRERVLFTEGGSIHFLSTEGASHGFSPDVLVLATGERTADIAALAVRAEVIRTFN